MINGHQINGAQINGSSEKVNYLAVDGTIAAPVGDSFFYETEPTGIEGEIARPTGQAYFGATFSGTIEKAAGSAAFSLDIMARVDVELGRPTGAASFSVDTMASVDGQIARATGQFFTGARFEGRIARATGSAGATTDTLAQIEATIARAVGSAEFTLDTLLQVEGTIARPVALYGIVDAVLKPATGYAAFTLQEALDRIAYALNIAAGGMTPYDAYEFDFIVRFQGRSYGLNSAGMFLLEGGDDDGTPIDAHIALPPTDFDATNVKRVPYVYIGSKGREQLKVSATADETRTLTSATQMTGRNKRARFPKGMKGVLWAHTISNIHGGPLDIDGIEILPQITRRKV